MNILFELSQARKRIADEKQELLERAKVCAVKAKQVNEGEVWLLDDNLWYVTIAVDGNVTLIEWLGSKELKLWEKTLIAYGKRVVNS